MKRLLILTMTLAGLWISACQKDKETEDPIGCEINNKYVNFSKDPNANRYYPVVLSTAYGTWDKLYYLGVYGKSLHTSVNEDLVIIIYSDKPFAAGNYVFNPTGLPQVKISVLSYEVPTMKVYESTQAAVVIESISDKNVKGTFSGTLVDIFNSGGTNTKDIRNGRFDVTIYP
jgi:hypothetical protein